MIEFLLKHGDVFAVFANVATIGTVVGLFFAYREYRHSVKVAEKAERRSGVELAIKESTNFGTELLPSMMKLRREIDKSECEFFKHFKLIREDENLRADASDVTPEDYQKLDVHGLEVMRLLNSIEGFAIPFAADVADDQIGFIECGRSFVSMFEANFGMYARTDLKQVYRATQTIYWRWRKRLEREEQLAKHVNLAKEFFDSTARLLGEDSRTKWASAPFSLMTDFLGRYLRKR